jgi:hypothetical protein
MKNIKYSIEWISCLNKLPENGRECLVFCSKHNQIALGDLVDKEDCDGNPSWNIDSGGTINFDVDFWSYLSKPKTDTEEYYVKENICYKFIEKIIESCLVNYED